MSLWSGGLASFYDGADMIENTSIKELKGIGEKTQKLFEKVGVSTVGDLIRYYPRGYDAVSYTHLTLPTILLV